MKTKHARMAKIAGSSILLLALISGAQAATTTFNDRVNINGNLNVDAGGGNIIIGGTGDDNIYIGNEPGNTAHIEIGTQDRGRAEIRIGGHDNIVKIKGVVDITRDVTIGGTSLTQTLDSKASAESVSILTGTVSDLNTSLNDIQTTIDEAHLTAGEANTAASRALDTANRMDGRLTEANTAASRALETAGTALDNSNEAIRRIDFTDRSVNRLDQKFEQKFDNLSKRVDQVDKYAKSYAAGAGASAMAINMAPAGGGLGASVYTVGGVQAVAIGARIPLNGSTDLGITVNHNSVTGTAGGVGVGMKW